MKTYDAHKAALAFPPLKGAELDLLKRSILERGQEFPAVIHEGKLLDGRNRQEALLQLIKEKKIPASTELKVVPFRGGSIAGFVDAANDKRRHLNESQRAMIATKLLPLFRKEAKEKQAAAAKATNRSKKKGQKALALTAPGRKASTASKQAAEAAGGKVSARSVERAAFVQKADPKLAKAVFEGELTVKQAEKQIRRREQVAQVKAYVPPAGEYPVITVDYSWKFDDELDGSDAVSGGCPYPPMSIEEICAFPIPAAKDCALFCWVTNSHLIDGNYDAVRRSLKDRYGFVPKGITTWEKDRTGTGWYFRNKTEHLVLFVRGKPVFTDEKPASHFRAPRGEHSEKPAAAYMAIEKFCAATVRLEMFARVKERAGWVTSGSELAPALPAGDSAEAGAAASIVDSAAAEHSQPAASGTYAPGLGKREFMETEVREKLESERSDPAWEYAHAEGRELTVVPDVPEPTPESVAAVPEDEITF